MTTGSLLEQALARLDEGDFRGAVELARKAAAAAPGDAAALQTQGIAEFRLGNHKDALALLRRSLRLKPLEPRTHLALGNVLQEQGQLEPAINAYRRALRFDPGLVPAWNDLGTALYASGRIEEAIGTFEQALRLEPDQHAVHENLGSALRRAGRFSEARRAFVRSLRLRLASRLRGLFGLAPKAPKAGLGVEISAFRRALELHAQGRRDEALALCEQMLAASSDDAEALHLKGLILVEHGRAAEGLPYLERACRNDAQIPEFHNTLGFCYRRLDDPGKAIRAYQRSLELNPQLALANVNLAELLCDLEDHASAERAARAAVASDPESPAARMVLIRALLGRGRFARAAAAARELLAKDESRIDGWLYLGQALREQDRLDEAWESFARALALAPDHYLAHVTVGAYHLECRRDPAKAIEHYREAKRLEPDSPAASLNEALARMAMGEFSPETWEGYESRRRQRSRAVAYRKVPLPEWDGAGAAGSGLLIYGEQGLGDEIMFASMIPQAAERVARCAFACDPRLVDLFARSFPGVRCFAWPREALAPDAPELRGLDRAIPLASLGRFFRSARGQFPRSGGYLRADAAKTQAWRARLAALGPGPYFGLAWQGGIWTTGRARRSIGLAALVRALEGTRARWVSLQLGAEQEKIDAESGSLAIRHFPEALASVDDSAALIAALDHVVSACSWIVHLSGALNKPVTVLAPFAPEWRYGLSGEEMVWYPSARILRQRAYGDWTEVLADLGGEIRSLAP